MSVLSKSPKVGTPSAQSGMVIMVVAMLLVPIGDTFSKLLTDVLGPFEIAFWRFGFQGAVLAVCVLLTRQKLGGGSMLWLLVGGIGSALTLAALIGAFAVMPIATAIAIFFVEPLILVVLSAVLLGEKTGWRRYVAVAVGLVGALIVIRPSWSDFGWRAVLPLVAAFSFALTAIAMRRLSRELGSMAIQFWFALIAAVGLGAVMLLSGGLELAPGADGPWSTLAIMGLLSALTFFLISEAFRRTPASTLAPFQYIEIVGATVLGYIVFGDFPDIWTWVGTAIILASGLYVFERERRTRLPNP